MGALRRLYRLRLKLDVSLYYAKANNAFFRQSPRELGSAQDVCAG